MSDFRQPRGVADASVVNLPGFSGLAGYLLPIGQTSTRGRAHDRISPALGLMPGQQESGPLVSFGEPLGSGDPECDCTCCGYGIVEVVDGLNGSFNTIEFVRFIEPLIVTPNSLVDLDCESKPRPFQ